MEDLNLKSAKESTRNINRDRNYGIRVGDTVDWTGLVVDYGTMDNNRIIVKWAELEEPIPEVAEWCTVTTKIEDK